MRWNWKLSWLPRRYSLRTLFVVVTVLSLLLGYVGSYYRLSRRGLLEAQPRSSLGFSYVPLNEYFAEDGVGRAKHNRLAKLYFPANFIDQKLFGTDGAFGDQ